MFLRGERITHPSEKATAGPCDDRESLSTAGLFSSRSDEAALGLEASAFELLGRGKVRCASAASLRAPCGGFPPLFGH
jgi:hypothetical protein